MSSLQSIKEKLSPLDIYDLYSDNQVTKELSTYAYALDILLLILQEGEFESFIGTASSYGLKIWENILGVNRDDMSIEQRRELLEERLSIGGQNFTRSGVEDILLSLGLSSLLFEYPRQNYMHIMCDSNYSQAQINKFKFDIDNLLPAHLDIFVDFRNFDFQYIDNLHYTFDTLDSKNLSWQEIENLTV